MRKSVFAWMATATVSLAAVGLTGCQHKENDLIGSVIWAPMEWETDVTMKGHTVTVPPQGGTYKFTCTNYTEFWLSDVEERIFDTDRNRITVTSSRPNEDDCRNIKGEWVEVTVLGNVMTVAVAANETGESRSATVVPTGGDIFSHFDFNQPIE